MTGHRHDGESTGYRRAFGTDEATGFDALSPGHAAGRTTPGDFAIRVRPVYEALLCCVRTGASVAVLPHQVQCRSSNHCRASREVNPPKTPTDPFAVDPTRATHCRCHTITNGYSDCGIWAARAGENDSWTCWSRCLTVR